MVEERKQKFWVAVSLSLFWNIVLQDPAISGPLTFTVADGGARCGRSGGTSGKLSFWWLLLVPCNLITFISGPGARQVPECWHTVLQTVSVTVLWPRRQVTPPHQSLLGEDVFFSYLS